MRYEIEIDPNALKGASIQPDPHARGVLLVLHFTHNDAAELARRSLVPFAEAPQLPPAAPPPEAPASDPVSRGEIHPQTFELLIPPPGMEFARGIKMRQRRDGRWEPDDWDEFKRRKAAAAPPKIPAGIDPATAEFLRNLQDPRPPAADPGGPPRRIPSMDEALAELGGLLAAGQPELDGFLSGARPPAGPLPPTIAIRDL